MKAVQNGTTGFVWNINAESCGNSMTTVLESIPPKPTENGEVLMGAPGQVLVTILPSAAVDCQIEFALARPWLLDWEEAENSSMYYKINVSSA